VKICEENANLVKNVKKYQALYKDLFIFILLIAMQNILQLDNNVKGMQYCILCFLSLTMIYIAQQYTENALLHFHGNMPHCYTCTHCLSCSRSPLVFPCHYYSSNAPYLCIHLSLMVYNLSN
jgi:hypothetical protein